MTATLIAASGIPGITLACLLQGAEQLHAGNGQQASLRHDHCNQAAAVLARPGTGA